YYRLNVCRIDVPPLRERKEDIPLLLDYFLASKISADNSKITITPDALKFLTSLSWMGNVRELFYILERAILTLEDNLTITTDIIKLVLPNQKTPFPESLSGISLESVERESILDNLKANNWNVNQTAKILGIDRRTLQRKIARYKIR
ncbi:MAG TPA: helix-turn-helix domain-containing protein, partial [Nitrospinota bacterium]|nr:helix-turn-helix domain-containing protein [Nitrospinota bacterium]